MTASAREWKTDCRHFRGDRPCVYRRECPGCPEYSQQRLQRLLEATGFDAVATETHARGTRPMAWTVATRS